MSRALYNHSLERKSPRLHAKLAKNWIFRSEGEYYQSVERTNKTWYWKKVLLKDTRLGKIHVDLMMDDYIFHPIGKMMDQKLVINQPFPNLHQEMKMVEKKKPMKVHSKKASKSKSSSTKSKQAKSKSKKIVKKPEPSKKKQTKKSSKEESKEEKHEQQTLRFRISGGPDRKAFMYNGKRMTQQQVKDAIMNLLPNAKYAETGNKDMIILANDVKEASKSAMGKNHSANVKIIHGLDGFYKIFGHEIIFSNERAHLKLNQ